MAKRYKLNNALDIQIADIIYCLIKECSSDDTFFLVTEWDGLNIVVEGDVKIDGYVEDDFHCGHMNGTGAWVTTSLEVNIDSVTAYTLDEDGEEITATAPDVDTYGIEKYLEWVLDR